MDVVVRPALFSVSSRRMRIPAAAMPMVMAKRGSNVLKGQIWVSESMDMDG